MIPYLSCQSAREMLDRFVDGELPVADQVIIETHVRWCDTCAARVSDMRLIGASVRLGSPSQTVNADDARALAVSQSEVLTRILAERDQSLSVRLHRGFEDQRLVWPALGATAALLACLFAALAVHRATTAADPESIAEMIEVLASKAPAQAAVVPPLSSYYPVQLDGRILAPRALSNEPALDALPEEEDALFTVDAVVTRDGRVVNYELLQSQRDGRKFTLGTDDMDALLEAVKRSRFEPAQAVDGGPVTVRMVWLLARTTVKAQAEDAVKPLTVGLLRSAPRPASS